MVGCARSIKKKKVQNAKDLEKALAFATELHREDTQKPKAEQRSLHDICQETEKAMLQQKIHVSLQHTTLMQHLNGGKSCREANEENHGWLTPEENELTIKYCLELTTRGFPFTHAMLRHHAETLLHARLGDAFKGLDKNWTSNFLDRHSDQLAQHWSSLLDTKRGQAVNENTHKAWCALLEHTIDEYGIQEDTLLAADESGFQPGTGQTQRVIGSAKQKIQHQQQDGNHENITVMVTICADRETIPPLVIYKGQTFSTNWHQDNILDAS